MLIVACFKLLQMKDDSKHALYIENLTEEYVTSYDEVTQILIKVGEMEPSKQMLLKIECTHAIYTFAVKLIWSLYAAGPFEQKSWSNKLKF